MVKALPLLEQREHISINSKQLCAMTACDGLQVRKLPTRVAERGAYI